MYIIQSPNRSCHNCLSLWSKKQENQGYFDEKSQLERQPGTGKNLKSSSKEAKYSSFPKGKNI